MNRTLQLRKPVGGPRLIMGWLLHPASLIVLFLLSLAAALFAGDAGAAPASGPALLFDNLSPQQETEAMAIYGEVRAQFVRLMGREVGQIPVRVREVEQLRGRGQASRTAGQTQGVTVYVGGEIVVQISASRKGSFGRVLSHELTHAFVREAFGAAENLPLSEGLAEYISSLLYGSEVNRDIRAASSVAHSSPQLMPYVSGYEFCSRYAERPGFAKFFEGQIKALDFGLGHLETVWKRQERGA